MRQKQKKQTNKNKTQERLLYRPVYLIIFCVLFSVDSRGGSARLNVGFHNIPLFFPPVVEVPNIPLRVSKCKAGYTRTFINNSFDLSSFL